jgi:quercetin dioxygenase-like cupin family protein
MQPEILLGIDRNIYVRQMTFKKAGDQEPEHQHQHDHHTVLFKGRALFKIKDKLVEQSAPAMVFIEAHTTHQITALEDDTQCACVHYLGNMKP